MLHFLTARSSHGGFQSCFVVLRQTAATCWPHGGSGCAVELRIDPNSVPSRTWPASLRLSTSPVPCRRNASHFSLYGSCNVLLKRDEHIAQPRRTQRPLHQMTRRYLCRPWPSFQEAIRPMSIWSMPANPPSVNVVITFVDESPPHLADGRRAVEARDGLEQLCR